LGPVLVVQTTRSKIEPDPENPKEGLLKPDVFAGRIEFRDVHFNYPTIKEKDVLTGLSFVVEPKQKVALVGAAGCGKSSTLRLIERFYNPDKGQVVQRIDIAYSS
jgi:ABC-type multidrug transport system fused ATPase/permease subunit